MAQNPSVEQPTAAKETSDFIPMGMSELQLAVPEIPGFKLYWFCDRPGRIPRALRQGWSFVSPEEVDVPNFKTLAGDVTADGNQDLGDRVSVYGYTDIGGRIVNQYLMKVKQELWDNLESVREQQSDRILDALRGSRVGAEREQGEDAQRRYQPKMRNTIFEKKR